MSATSTVDDPLDILRTRLPFELHDHVLSEIESPRDLAALAATCKYWAGLIMPRHIEYRILRFSLKTNNVELANDPFRPFFDALFHLASSPALARNIREVDITEYRITRSQRNVLPHPLVESWNGSEEKKNVEWSLCALYLRMALLSMGSLSKFVWDMPSSTTLLTFEERFRCDEEQRAIFEVLQQLKTLTSLDVKIYGFTDLEFCSDSYPLWHISGLKSLRFAGPHHMAIANCFDAMLGRNTLLQVLSIDLPFAQFNRVDFKSFHFPYLRKLTLRPIRLSHQAQDVCTVCNDIISFLYAHPIIEDLRWRTTHDPGIQPGLLPNVKRVVQCSPGLIYSLLQDQTIPQRKWEVISNVNLSAMTMPTLRRIDGSRIKKLHISQYDVLEQLDEVAALCPNVSHLNIIDSRIQCEHYTLERYIATISNFRTVESIHAPSLFKRLFFLPFNKKQIAFSSLSAGCSRLISFGSADNHHSVLNRVDGEDVTWKLIFTDPNNRE